MYVKNTLTRNEVKAALQQNSKSVSMPFDLFKNVDSISNC